MFSVCNSYRLSSGSSVTSYQLHQLRNWVVLSSGKCDYTKWWTWHTERVVCNTNAWTGYTAGCSYHTNGASSLKKGCSCESHIPNPYVSLQCVGNSPQGGSGFKTGATSPSAQRSDEGLEPDAAAGRVLMNDVIYVASGRRQFLLVVQLRFHIRFSNADAIRTSCVPGVRHIAHASGLWMLLAL